MSPDLDIGQSYWVQTDSADFYVAAKFIQDHGDDNLQFETHDDRGTVFYTQSSHVIGVIPPPAHMTLQTNFVDLVSAVDISEPSILWNLKSRFKRNEIYSAIGSILIAFNPYKYIESLYHPELMKKYLDINVISDSSSSLTGNGAPPHIWSIARNAYLQLNQTATRQAIIISGESGAGI